MKFLVIVFVFIILIFRSPVFGQVAKFTGTWVGSIENIWMGEKEIQKTVKLRIKIIANKVTQYFWDDTKNEWYTKNDYLTQRFEAIKNQFIYYWIRNNELWTETQVFLLSYIKNNKLYITWSRQVNDRSNTEIKPWSAQGSAYFVKEE